MANKPKAKGRKGEHEVARLVGGKRTPLSGAIAGDADIALPSGSIWHDWKIEVKRRAGFGALSFMEAWLQAEATIGIGGRAKPMVFGRADKGAWFVFVKAEDLIQWAEALTEMGNGNVVRQRVTQIARELTELARGIE